MLLSAPNDQQQLLLFLSEAARAQQTNQIRSHVGNLIWLVML